jgi:transcriptional regulator EpsA
MAAVSSELNLNIAAAAPVPMLAVGLGSDRQAGAFASADRAGLPTWNPEELEPWLLNVDASLRVHARHQLFGWTQGVLQSLVRHDILVCAVRSGGDASYQADCFASPWLDSKRLAQAFRQDTALVAQLSAEWLDHDFRPLTLDATLDGPLTRGPFAAELRQPGAPNAIVHGVLDPSGKPASLYLWAAGPGELDRQSAQLVELIVPFVHAAWMRTLARPMADRVVADETVDRLTRREREILRWVHVGKSNYEIGAILGISPLTVKNHVQHILRKLNVHNRTHAIGRALALRILDT